MLRLNEEPAVSYHGFLPPYAEQYMVEGFYPNLPQSAFTLLASDQVDLWVHPQELDTSLTAQLADFKAQGFDHPDTALLLTANSAVPLGDALHAVHTVTPIEAGLGYIRAHREDGYRYRQDPAFNASDTAEIQRLATALAPYSRAVIVDQWTETGTTINHATRLIRAAGWEGELATIRGRWYAHASPDRVDFERLGCTYDEDAEKLSQIGQKVGQALVKRLKTN
jgi:hypothetical protein